MKDRSCCDLVHDLVLPTLLFAALGGMTWAVRGSSGYGTVSGCTFAGVAWGAAWWFIARDPSREQSRRYTSGWIVLAVAVGVGLSGARGWMQWPAFFEGHLQTNYAKGQFVPISRIYGFLWMFLAGVPWAGLGACGLAWCGSLRETRLCHWALRIGCGIGVAALLRYLIVKYPQYFLPLYDSLQSQYHDFEHNPNLRKLTNDCRATMVHLGYLLGFLFYEVIRRDWKNALLILTVGVVNGCGWALCQNWTWAHRFFEHASFNFWRCWESSGGISIGVAYGIAYFLVNRPMSDRERAIVTGSQTLLVSIGANDRDLNHPETERHRTLTLQRSIAGPNFQWFVVFVGLTAFYFGLTSRLSLSLRYPWLDGWGGVYATVGVLFGLLYYLRNRGIGADDGSDRSGANGFGAIGAALLAAGAIGGFFLPQKEMFQYGLIYFAGLMAVGGVCYLLNRQNFQAELRATTPRDGDPNLERFGLAVGLLYGLGISIRSGLKGWFNIYRGNEDYWSGVLWKYLGALYLVCLIAIVAWTLFRPLPRNFRGNVFPHAYGLMWLVLIVLNVLAQLITGPPWVWNEMAFSIYYLLLFAITAVIVVHYQYVKTITPR